jgi:uncharacterized iron-regulated protein
MNQVKARGFTPLAPILGTAGVVAVLLVVGLASLATAHPHRDSDASDIIVQRVNPADPQELSALLSSIETNRAVMIGETHDRYDHHQNQLAVIRGLDERRIPIAIGMEWFQRPFQSHLDDFVAGKIDLMTLIERTEWHQRWRFDVDLYRDILTYAQQHRIPLVALNAATETVKAVSGSGIDGLDDQTRALFPTRVELAQGAYREQLVSVFAMHGPMQKTHLQRFLEVQYVWDQTMASTAGEYLNANPERTLVVLAGSGHLLHDDAIPSRLRRIHPGAQSVLVTDTGWLPPGAEPRYVLAPSDLDDGSPQQLADASAD